MSIRDAQVTDCLKSPPKWLSLREGRRFCCLHADLANPTSNTIYRKIGFVPVADFQEYTFEKVPNQRLHDNGIHCSRA